MSEILVIPIWYFVQNKREEFSHFSIDEEKSLLQPSSTALNEQRLRGKIFFAPPPLLLKKTF